MRSLVLTLLVSSALPGCGGESSAVDGDAGSPDADADADAGDDADAGTVEVIPFNNPFGLNVHSASDEMLDQFSNTGIGWFRIDAEWAQNEPVEGSYDWTNTDRLVAKIKSRGGFVNLVVAYTPAWASGTSNPAAMPLDPTKFVRYVRAVAERYRTTADCIGIWNEPNLQQFFAGAKSQYINDLLVPSLAAVKQVAPSLPTCGPDLSSSGNERTDWMGPILDAAGPTLDIITHHQYDGNDTPAGRISEIQKMRDFVVERGHGAKPFWITEIGWDAPRFTRAQQAQYLEDVMAAMQTRPWWGKTFWYDSHGVGWGILDGEGGATTPSFTAYTDVIAQSPYMPTLCDGQTEFSTSAACEQAFSGSFCLVDVNTNCHVNGAGGATLPSGGQLNLAEQRESADGRFRLVLQGDGNLVLYRAAQVLWSSQTSGSGATLLSMQSDGNLVLYAGATVVWSSNTQGNPGARLDVQNDGNLAIRTTGATKLWSSNTCCY